MDSIFTMTVGSAIAMISVVGATLTFFMYLAKQIFESFKTKKSSNTELIEKQLEALKEEIDELKESLEAKDQDLRSYIISSNKDRKEEIIKLGDRIEKLYEMLINKWAGK